ncbi:response regulator transcription factor [Pseudothauera nasutitermitis]|uniref:Response regulator transcription factor n=1 Tax=Pseudothauera nasutitermitis TaxID=2565930 RepID=A0A4S4B685_9RHOO|nr:response regulator transcription factor [Pseudothauera nasutitermitis]THF67336.1 response regulator transcription factor [Pseudothauera nasutitermitis]
MIRILIADDHDILRAGLKHILSESGDIAVGGEACNGAEAMVRLRAGQWDAVVLDLNMPGRNGIELIKQVKSEFPRLPILVLSMYQEDIYAVRALKAGASGYLCKDNAEALLAEAIRKIVGGGLFINQSVAENLTRDMLQGRHTQLPHNRLTDRNYQIFLMLVQGMGVSEIAKRLSLSVKTVSTHKANIQLKMGLGNTAELVRYAIQHHLIENDVPLSE